MQDEKEQKLLALEDKIDKIYLSVEKTRIYFKWTLIISVAVVVLSVIGTLVMLPALFSSIGAISTTLPGY